MDFQQWKRYEIRVDAFSCWRLQCCSAPRVAVGQNNRMRNSKEKARPVTRKEDIAAEKSVVLESEFLSVSLSQKREAIPHSEFFF